MGMIGQHIPRVEDRSLLTGEARFTGDIACDALDVAFVRSTIAHARITHIDVDVARRAPEVVAVFTAGDLGNVDGIFPIPLAAELVRPLIALDRVRFCGEIVAVVIARSLASAIDAAESVQVTYEPLPIMATLAAALAAGAVPLFDGFASNDVLSEQTDAAELSARQEAFSASSVTIELDMINQRVASSPLETNAVLVVPDGDELTVHCSTQTPHAIRDAIATVCSLDTSQVRVIATWVGGGFGAKSMPDVEYTLAARCALALGQPVRWRQSRTENLLTMHGRDQRQRVCVAVGTDGTMRAIHADIVSDNGAYPGMNHLLAGFTARMLPGPYGFAHATSTVRSVATNTSPVFGYRGAGRPEATSLLERIIDVVAMELSIDPAELRKRNLLGDDVFPYTTPTGAVYDSGAYASALDRALTGARYSKRRREQAARRANNATMLLGIGMCAYVEVTAGAGPTEFADAEVHADGSVSIRVGTMSFGQGHHTTYAQIAADTLGVDMTLVSVLEGDTRDVVRGFGTYGSRSMQVGGSAVQAACQHVIERARTTASQLLEASIEDIVFANGSFSVAGVPSRTIDLSEIAAHLASPTEHETDERCRLYAFVDWPRPASTYPFGAHVSIVEVDVETGFVTLLEHVAVDDCGAVLNPIIVEGQVHGGIAQGAAQALLEEVVHDDDGNVLTANFADYAIVTASSLPSFTVIPHVTPTPINPLGAKGIGESGTIGATPAVHNAVIDALAHLGVRHLDMPLSPERVWRAIQGDHPRVVVSRR